MKFTMVFLLLLIISVCFASENDSLLVKNEILEAEYKHAISIYLDSIEQTLHYEYGTIKLKNDIATIIIPSDFKYLNGKDSEMILTDIWGNPPREELDQSYGMLIPKGVSPLRGFSYAINITYAKEGFIYDEDAKDIDYDELLEGMQNDSKAINEERIKLGYEPVYLVGWASSPFYDEADKKLHWAKELKFGDDEKNTLNYNIRILGRKGYLELNAIGEMDVLDEVKNNIDEVLQSVNFNDGHRYIDFNPDLDEVAAYGIGGLIAGKMLLKAGLFAKFGLILAKFWKVIALGFAGLIAAFRKFGSPKDQKSV